MFTQMCSGLRKVQFHSSTRHGFFIPRPTYGFVHIYDIMLTSSNKEEHWTIIINEICFRLEQRGVIIGLGKVKFSQTKLDIHKHSDSK